MNLLCSFTGVWFYSWTWGNESSDSIAQRLALHCANHYCKLHYCKPQHSTKFHSGYFRSKSAAFKPNHMQSNTMYGFASIFNWVLLCLFIFCRSMVSLYPGMQDILTTLLMTPINAHFCKILCLETNVHSLLCVLINTIKIFVTYRNVFSFVFDKHGKELS